MGDCRADQGSDGAAAELTDIDHHQAEKTGMFHRMV
jgi:hypothetical protein